MNAQQIVGSLLEDLIVESTLYPWGSLVSNWYYKDLQKAPPDVAEISVQKYKRWLANPETVNFESKGGTIYAVEVLRKWHAVCWVEGTHDSALVVWLHLLKYDDYDAYLDEITDKTATINRVQQLVANIAAELKFVPQPVPDKTGKKPSDKNAPAPKPPVKRMTAAERKAAKKAADKLRKERFRRWNVKEDSTAARLIRSWL